MTDARHTGLGTSDLDSRTPPAQITDAVVAMVTAMLERDTTSQTLDALRAGALLAGGGALRPDITHQLAERLHAPCQPGTRPAHRRRPRRRRTPEGRLHPPLSGRHSHNIAAPALTHHPRRHHGRPNPLRLPSPRKGETAWPARSPGTAATRRALRVLLWRWRRNALRRRTDLLQAWIALSLFLATLAATPAATVLAEETAHRHYQQAARHQASTRHATPAVLVDDAPVTPNRDRTKRSMPCIR